MTPGRGAPLDLFPLTPEEQWSFVIQALRGATNELVDGVTSLVAAMQAQAAARYESPSLLHDASQVLTGMTDVDWTVWERPEERPGPRAHEGRMALNQAFVHGRSLALEACRRFDPVLTMTLYHGFDRWHNVPKYLEDVPEALSHDWVDDALLLPLMATVRERRIEVERTALLDAVSNGASSPGLETGVRRRRI